MFTSGEPQVSLLGAVSLPSISCLENATLDGLGVTFEWTARRRGAPWSDAETKQFYERVREAQNGRQLIILEDTLAAGDSYLLTFRAEVIGDVVQL